MYVRLHVNADCANHVYRTEAVKLLVPERTSSGLGGESAYPNVREAGTAKRGRFLRLLSELALVQDYRQINKSAKRTHAKEAGQDESCEQQDEADGELLVLGDGRCEGLARRGVPELLERRGRHREYVRYELYWARCMSSKACRSMLSNSRKVVEPEHKPLDYWIEHL